MWLIVLLTLFNAAANNKTFFLEYRLTIAGLPLNILDGLITLGLIWCVLRPRGSRPPTPRVHPALAAIVAFYTIGLISGLVNSPREASAYEVVNTIHNYLALPAAVLLGYFLFDRPRQGLFFCRLSVLAGTIAAFMVLLFFKEAGTTRQAMVNVNNLRTVDYVPMYAGLGALLILSGLVARLRVLPIILGLPIAVFSVVGQFATLSRSEWLPTTATLLMVPAALPFGRKLIRSGGVVLTLAALGGVLMLSLNLASTSFGWNVARKVDDKLWSLVPGQREGQVEHKAWDSRVPSALREVEMWAEHPVLGAGFGSQSVEELSNPLGAFYHNAFTSTLCASGPFGLLGMIAVVASCFVVGRRLLFDRLDSPSMLVGLLAVIAGIYCTIYGLSTMSINIMRGALPLGLICGVTLRTRAVQLTMKGEYEDYLDEAADRMVPILDQDGVAAFRPSLLSGPV